MGTIRIYKNIEIMIKEKSEMAERGLEIDLTGPEGNATK